MTFGERLVAARKEKGYTQKELAEKLSITPTRLNYWEKDKRNPDVDMIWKLIEVLNISGDWLLGRDDKAIKTAPESDESESEAAVQRRTQILYNAFVDCGFIPAGGDLTDDQLRFCMGLADMLNIYFGAGK